LVYVGLRNEALDQEREDAEQDQEAPGPPSPRNVPSNGQGRRSPL
jgi:hypothetical protein